MTAGAVFEAFFPSTYLVTATSHAALIAEATVFRQIVSDFEFQRLAIGRDIQYDRLPKDPTALPLQSI